jgi:Fuc2NAc and GlcNAc transferase
MKYSILFIVPFIISFFGSWLIKSYGYELGIIDVPSERSSHEKIIPKGGGIGILCAFILGGFYFKISLFFLAPSVLLSLVSFFGDKFDINPKVRLFVQFLCSFVFLFGILISASSDIVNYFTFLFFAVFIVGTANFYNFMDGINGIAGITGAIAFFFLGFFGYLNDFQLSHVLFCFSVAAACIGFLPFNIPDAKIFMGDIGSVLLGFVFACFGVLFSTTFLDFMCICGFLFLFYADELTTMYIRIKDREKLSKPHRRHLYQLFANELNIKHWKVSFVFGIVQILISIAVLALKQFGIIPVLFFYAFIFGLFIYVSILVRKKIRNLAFN